MTCNAQVSQDDVRCPNCRETMAYDQEDSFYRCPVCKGQYWPNDKAMPCPGCGRPMKLNKLRGFHQCSGCGSEFWPPEETEEEEDPELGRGSYAGLGLVYLGEIRRGSGRSKSSGGRKRKKKKAMPRVISQKYLLY